ncbi:MAG: universal stress protein [Proteobacteria bacterium]|nr:universal stress protein [Pseudomonadota bacterium]
MRKLENILVVLEPQTSDQPALARAIYLATASGAKLHLFMCAYDTAIGIASFLSGGQRQNFIQTILDGSKVLVERLAAGAREKGIVVSSAVRWGRHPTDAILHEAEQGFDLMMKHARAQSRADMMFHSIEWSLMRYGPCPVMLVKEGQWDDVGQVLAAVDAAPESDTHQTLNKAILEHARFLAELLNFDLHLVTAYPAPPVFGMVSSAADQAVNYRARMSAMVTSYLADLGEQYGVTEQFQHAVEGPVDWVIPHVSEELVTEFVVMGNVCREGRAGLSIGTSAESILEQLNTNVLMVQVTSEAS